jgi:hypothetical protein
LRTSYCDGVLHMLQNLISTLPINMITLIEPHEIRILIQVPSVFVTLGDVIAWQPHEVTSNPIIIK